MTTAARPTFEPAKGGMGRGERDLSALSKQYSARDLPSHTKLKYREHGQNTENELRGRDFRRDLDDRERQARDRRAGGSNSASVSASSSSSSTSGASGAIARESTSSSSKKPRLEAIAPANLDADDPQDSDSDSDGSDDEAVLFAELERIRRERADEEAKKARQRQEHEEKIRMENIISGNPLLNLAAAPKQDMKVRRRWDDDVVFKNCAAAESDKPDKVFINDSLRSEFHKRFMEKYIK